MGKLDYESWKKSVRFFIDKYEGPEYTLKEDVLEKLYSEYHLNAKMAAWKYRLQNALKTN